MGSGAGTVTPRAWDPGAPGTLGSFAEQWALSACHVQAQDGPRAHEQASRPQGSGRKVGWRRREERRAGLRRSSNSDRRLRAGGSGVGSTEEPG